MLPQLTWAQAPPGDDGVTRFGKVEVERIRPDALPKKDLTRRAMGPLLRPSRLPTPPSRQELRALEGRLHKAVVTITALHTPSGPMRTTPMLYEGHAVWVRPTPKAKPVLVTTADWLARVQEMYLTPTKPRSSRGVSLSALQPAQRIRDFNRAKARLPKLEVERRDPWRNLLILKTPAGVTPPPQALDLFDATTTPLAYTYGYSPALHPAMVPTVVAPTPADNDATAFYYQTAFPAILGAPIVSERGELVMLTAFRSAQDPKLTLAIPPHPLADFLGASPTP